MPWQELSILDQRHEFVVLASGAGASTMRLCARFGIRRETGHLWLRRFLGKAAPRRSVTD